MTIRLLMRLAERIRRRFLIRMMAVRCDTSTTSTRPACSTQDAPGYPSTSPPWPARSLYFFPSPCRLHLSFVLLAQPGMRLFRHFPTQIRNNTLHRHGILLTMRTCSPRGLCLIALSLSRSSLFAGRREAPEWLQPEPLFLGISGKSRRTVYGRSKSRSIASPLSAH